MKVLLFSFLFLAFTCKAEINIGHVVGISDGDTINVLSLDNKQTKVRLDSIDAPEKNQDFGQASKKYLSSLIFKKQVTIEPHKIDKYGRTVASVWFDNKSVNLEMIKAGMAWVYRKYSDNPIFYEAEQQAKTSRIGLWSQPNPKPPWEFRHPDQYPTKQTQLPTSLVSITENRTERLYWVGLSHSSKRKNKNFEWPVWRMLQNTSSKKIEIANFLVTFPNITRKFNCIINY